MENLFQDTDPDDIRIDPEKNYLEELVGEGKKFKSEADLARAKAESDAFILRLQRENKELRDSQKSASTIEEIVDQIRREREAAQSNNTNQEPPDGNVDPPKQISQQDIEALLEKKLTESISNRERQRTASQNLQTVEDMAQKVFGPNFRAELERRRKELNLGSEFLTNLAKEQPNAFLKLLDIKEETPDRRTGAPPASQVNSSSSSQKTGVKNWKYYQNLRRTNEKEFASPVVQMEMFKALQEQGDDFYN